MKKRVKKKSVKQRAMKKSKKTKRLTWRQLDARRREQDHLWIMRQVTTIRAQLVAISRAQDAIVAVMQPIFNDYIRRPLKIDDFNRLEFQALVDQQAKEHPEMFSDRHANV